MNRIESIMKPLTWFMALLVVAVVAGCSSGSSSSAALSSAKAITAYSLAGTTGTIDESAKTITVAKPSGAGLTALVATFTTTGASVKVGTPAVMQVSGTTPNDFRTSKVYTVTAADGTTATYTVTVTVASTTTVLPGLAGTTGANATNPTVNSANSSNGDTNVPTRISHATGATYTVTAKQVTATFNEAMDPTTISSSPAGTLLTFSLKETVSGTDVPGTVSMNTANTIATFAPTAVALSAGISYTATITTAAKNAGGTAIPKSVAWSFTTRSANAATQTSNVPFVGQEPVDLLTSGNYVIFAGMGVKNPNSNSLITGDIGTGPAVVAADSTGFNFIADSSNQFATSSQLLGGGKFYAYDYAVPTPTTMNTASNDMMAAYLEARDRSTPDATELGTGNISSLTIYPGLYKWGTSVQIDANTQLTLDAQGDTNAVWIFQIAIDLPVASCASCSSAADAAGTKVILAGGAKASNIFWQVGDASAAGATLGTYSTFNGNILSSKAVVMQTGATLTGRALAAALVTLDASVVGQ